MTASDSDNALGDAMKNLADNHRFDHFLQRQLQSAKPYIDDNHFSARVMASLPAAKPAIGWRERLIVLVPLLIISALVLSQNPVLAFAIKSWVLLSMLSLDNLFKIVVELSLVALCGVGCWLARQYRWL